jgi:hypothetical protein
MFALDFSSTRLKINAPPRGDIRPVAAPKINLVTKITVISFKKYGAKPEATNKIMEINIRVLYLMAVPAIFPPIRENGIMAKDGSVAISNIEVKGTSGKA